MPVQSLPWLPSSEQFLRAIVAGSELGESRARREAQERESRRPRFIGGGGGFRPPPSQQPPVPPTTDPHLVLNGSILSMVDPNAQNVPATTSPRPFDVAGQQFITNPATGQPEPFVEPSTIEKVGNDLVQITKRPGIQGLLGSSPETIGVNKLYEGGNTADGVRMTAADISGITDPGLREYAMVQNPPRISGSPTAISNYLAQASAPQFPVPKAAEVIRVTSDGRRAVFDANTKQFIRYVD